MATLSSLKGNSNQNSRSENSALSVAQAMDYAKRALESVRIKVVGEISELSNKPGYKAVYFTLSDKDAAMSCLMWKNVYDRSKVALKTGALVEVTGYFSLYAAKGRMNFVATSVALAGEGDLRLKVAMLAEKLRVAGLMEPSRKKPIPAQVSKVAVVTSPRGKAIHDVLRTLRRRSPQIEVYVIGIPVEGDIASESICNGLKVADNSDCDCILLVRGGGSYEDLMPFNDEQVARTVAKCAKPVITGIGHEPDNSIADMVADVRCSTPTAAAEAVSEDISDIARSLVDARNRMGRALLSKVALAKTHVDQLSRRPVFSDPQFLTATLSMRLDADAERLSAAIPNAIAADAQKLDHAHAALLRVGKTMLDRPKNSISFYSSRLNDLSPLAILARGYAIAYDEDGHVVDDADKVNVEDRLKIRVSNGTIDCEVIDTDSERKADE